MTPAPKSESNDLRNAFEAPLGIMLGKTGVLSQEQQDESGYRQAIMVVMRDALQEGTLDAEALPSFKGDVDLLAIATMPEEELDQIGEDNNLSVDAFKAAQELVNSKQGVNTPEDTITVPPIGMIHTKLHVSKDVAKAAMIAQQAIRASDTALRLMEGESDPSNHEKKREFAFLDKEDNADLKRIMQLHRQLSAKEASLEQSAVYDQAKAALFVVDMAFEKAQEMFAASDYPALADMVAGVAADNQQRFENAKPKPLVLDTQNKVDGSCPGPEASCSAVTPAAKSEPVIKVPGR